MATHADWLALVQLDGLVISEPVLEEHFPGGPNAVTKGLHNWFRRQAERYRVSKSEQDLTKRADGARQWIDFLLEHVLELPRASWRKAAEVPENLRVYLDEFEQELRPDRVLVHGDKVVLLVSIVPPDQQLDRRDRRAGRWKASPTTKLDRLLRETEHQLGLVTNGEDFRLLYAPPGLNGGHITWTSRVLVEEKATLDAFASLVGRDLLLPATESAYSLADLCRISQDRQMEVADQLGEQVRNGLERLIWAWDAADRATHGQLLREMSEDQIYEMGMVVMMRLVFLLYAEERDLLPHGEVLYDQGYGLTYLWHRLLQQRREDPVRMEQTHDAWDRFLATCRLVHGGCRHPDLALPAYGGRLFNPQRFPVLEDTECRVTNRTFYEVLRLLLFARQRKGGEPQRVGYWAIDVEQIGYIYEGLLDHRCARAGDVPMVKFRGAGEASLPVTELEQLDQDALVKRVVADTGRKEDAVREALQRAEPDEKETEQLKGFPPDVVERVRPFAGVIQCEEVVPPRWRFLTTGTSRRASGAHYTPQSLTERIVRVTLEPLVYRNVEGKPGLLVEPREVKSPREILELKVCDIAMGSGAFLVQAVRYLGDRLVEAWDRAVVAAQKQYTDAVLAMPNAEPLRDDEGDRPIDPEKRDEMILWARRYVVERCIYGVDVNPLAVEMAKLSLWLTTLSKDRPFTFLDHALRCGDSLVGVDMEQLLTWSLDRKGSAPILEPLVKKAVDEALELRRQLQQITVVEAADSERKKALHEKAEAAMDRVRLAGDLIVAPSFTDEKAPKQAELRDTLLSRYVAARDGKAWKELQREAKRLLDGQRTFHWPLEFPEVFGNGRNGFDGVLGNPPFLGGTRISTVYGRPYLLYLRVIFTAFKNRADLCALFFIRAFDFLGPESTLGLVATNTVAQGDTRESGLQSIESVGGVIYEAVSSMVWPGPAAVHVSNVFLRKGQHHGIAILDNCPVGAISSFLKPQSLSAPSKGSPHKLATNANLSFQGSKLDGQGFFLDEAEARTLKKHAEDRRYVRPYMGGKDVTDRPRQDAARWVVDFRGVALQKAKEAQGCFSIVESRVKPERANHSEKRARENWWLFQRSRPELYTAIKALEEVLVTVLHAKHHCPCFVNQDQVFGHALGVFATDRRSSFAIMQSALHEEWARLHGSSLETRMRYTPTDCFETFPFPQNLCPAQQATLDEIGEAYHEHRRQLMLATQEGLTKTYNHFHDPACKDPGIQKLRDLHVQMDNAVRDAYGWDDLDLEHGWTETVTTEEKKDKKTGKARTIEKKEHRYTISERAKQEVLRRLLELNHKIYQEEVEAGLHDKKKAKNAKSAAATQPSSKAEKRKTKSASAPQTLSLFDDAALQLTAVEKHDEHDGLSESAAALLEALDGASTWQSKSELLDASGISATKWNTAIKELLAAELVEKQGELRGTRYRKRGDA